MTKRQTSGPTTTTGVFAGRVFPFTPTETGRASAWDAVGPVLPGGDLGGDLQTGQSWSVRYQPTTATGQPAPQYATVLDDAWYPVQDPDQPGAFRVQQQRELTVCTDPAHPGDTEVWADAVYTDDPAVFTSLDQATAHAQALAHQAALTGTTHTLHPDPDPAQTGPQPAATADGHLDHGQAQTDGTSADTTDALAADLTLDDPELSL